MDRWFCFDGWDYRTFASAADARRAAEDALESFRVDAWASGVWSDAVRRVSWGHVLESVFEQVLPVVTGDVSQFFLDAETPTDETKAE
jgi:hypothetical protein